MFAAWKSGSLVYNDAFMMPDHRPPELSARRKRTAAGRGAARGLHRESRAAESSVSGSERPASAETSR
jgi:hypothetical protein